MKFHYSFLKIVGGSDLSRSRLPYMEADSGRRGPVVWLTACCHGDEVGGIVVVQEVFRRLRKLPLRSGAVRAFPLMNPLGFEGRSRHVTMSGEDLNRCFPGLPGGTLAERIADRIFTRIVETEPSVVLDLHNDWIRSIPYVVLDSSDSETSADVRKQSEEIAVVTGFPVVREVTPTRRTLSHSLLHRGLSAVTVELGESHVVNEQMVDFGARAVFNVLSHLNMLREDWEPFRYPLPYEIGTRPMEYVSQPVSSASGILRFLAEPGDVVQRGQPIAKIQNAFGKLRATLCATDDALVLGHADSSVAYPGGPVMAFARLNKSQLRA
jgi:predicted deacylase